jgi:hypothetical protein
MAWRTHLSTQLARRVTRAPIRELTRPAFVLTSVGSGSTLLRLILNSHSALYAPHELHLRHITVEFADVTARHAMTALDLDQQALTHMLWDRLLAEALRRSGKQQLVEKTPHLVLSWAQVAACWPDSRFIFLLRHPAAVLGASRADVATVTTYLTALRDARRSLPGLTVRYEDLTADPGRESRRMCEFLGVPYEPAMVQYGAHDHERLEYGDPAGEIRSGSVRPPAPRPDIDLPPALRQLATDLGY